MGSRVLVVDDEAGLREILRVMLSRAGYEVVSVDGQTQAIAQLRSGDPFDVVITDLSMPDGSGLDLVSTVRARRPTMNGGRRCHAEH